MGAALSVVLAARGHAEFVPAIVQASYLAALELAVVTACAVLFSAISTPVLSALYTVGFYLLGQWSYDVRELAVKLPPAVGGVLQVAANLVPNLPIFNMRTLAASAHTAPLAQIGIGTLYAAIYCGCALALATAAFETRDFK